MSMKTLKRAPGAASALVLQEGKGFVCGLDLGQSVDYSALCALERIADWEDRNTPFRHHIRFVKRYPLGTRYTDVTEDVVENFLRNEDLWVQTEERESDGGPIERPTLVIDASGVGAAVRDEFIRSYDVERPRTKAVIITGGVQENFEKGTYRVPKSRLLERMKVDAEFGMLQISSGLPLLDTLKEELANIRPKIRADAKFLSYEEIRESVHDDMVLAAALAHWGARRFRPRAVVDLPPSLRGALVPTRRSRRRRAG